MREKTPWPVAKGAWNQHAREANCSGDGLDLEVGLLVW